MTEIQQAKAKLKEMIDQRNHLAVEIRQQEKVVDELEHGHEDQIRHKLGLTDTAFGALKELVERGVVNWKGKFRHPTKINVAPIWRTMGERDDPMHSKRSSLAEEYDKFARSVGVELMHHRWRDGEGNDAYGKPTLGHSHQLNDSDNDYLKFVNKFGEPTNLEMEYIKSGRSPEGPEDEQAALDAMNHHGH